MNREKILSVKNLFVKFNSRGRELTVLRDLSLDLYRGEILAIVGESGSGKSVFSKSLIGLLDKNGFIEKGSIIYRRRDISKYKSEKQWINIRGKEISMVFQEPMTSLNPLKPIGKQIGESVKLHQGLRTRDIKKEVLKTLEEVGISNPKKRYYQYPHEFSGGMRQRVVIAIAISCRPKILICDEPTTALDVTIQAQILKLLRKLKTKYNLSIIYISHDLSVVSNIADRVAVMYAGDIVEIGKVEEVFLNPKHPYTWALLSSLPELGERGKPLYGIKGNPPDLFSEIKGDAFAMRNPKALKIDFIKKPPYFSVSPTHKAKTWLLDPRAPNLDPPKSIYKLKKIFRRKKL